MSLRGYIIRAESFVGDDFGFVSIDPNPVNRKGSPPRAVDSEKTLVMWSHGSTYGVVGSKVGDFIGTYGLNSGSHEGLFTHREIAEKLVKKYSGLRYKEIEWIENPLVHKLASGKPRKRKPRWLPEKDVDIVHLYSDMCIDTTNPIVPETDFYTAVSDRVAYIYPVLMCNEKVYKEIREMNFTCLNIGWGKIV